MIRPILLILLSSFVTSAQPASREVLVNLTELRGDSVTLHEDAATGGLDLLVTYPAGHVFKPHWHESNERIILIEGRLSLGPNAGEKFLDPGGFAFLPAREMQRLSCVAKSRCVFYISWDGSPRSHY